MFTLVKQLTEFISDIIKNLMCFALKYINVCVCTHVCVYKILFITLFSIHFSIARD